MKKCPKCKRLLPLDQFPMYSGRTHSYCHDCERIRLRAKSKKRYKSKGDFIRKKSMEWFVANRQRARITRRKWSQGVIAQVVEHYGGTPPKCQCCGETERIFLTIDHMQNDGYIERRILGKNKPRQGGYSTYVQIIKDGFPEGKYQILCYNCNCGRARNGGICPHKMTP